MEMTKRVLDIRCTKALITHIVFSFIFFEQSEASLLIASVALCFYLFRTNLCLIYEKNNPLDRSESVQVWVILDYIAGVMLILPDLVLIMHYKFETEIANFYK